jgi:hypothetical protein
MSVIITPQEKKRSKWDVLFYAIVGLGGAYIALKYILPLIGGLSFGTPTPAPAPSGSCNRDKGGVTPPPTTQYPPPSITQRYKWWTAGEKTTGVPQFIGQTFGGGSPVIIPLTEKAEKYIVPYNRALVR